MTAELTAIIKDTFIEKAIQSAIVIDDDFPSYFNLVNGIVGNPDLSNAYRSNIQRTLSFDRFFSSKNIYCTIDNGINVIDKLDKIRKSDLILIDYLLDGQNPDKTLDVIYQLRDCDNLNFVVIYTSENLNKVFETVLGTLRGSNKCNKMIMEFYEKSDDEELNAELEDIWGQISSQIDSGTELRLTDSEVKIILLNQDEKKIRSRIVQLIHKIGVNGKLINILYDLVKTDSLSKINFLEKPLSDIEIIASSSDNLWLQSGNIFVSLFKKTASEDGDAVDIWNSLIQSVIDWNPSYYQILISEIQNIIESKSFSFIKPLLNDKYSQAAWLNELISSKDTQSMLSKINVIFNMFSESLSEDIKKSSLGLFSNSLLSCYLRSLQASEKNSIDFSSEHFNLDKNKNIICDMYHALNMNMSSMNYVDGHISTGTIFKLTKKGSDNWYLCVSAACDMVPSQSSSAFLKRIMPHRLIKVIKLYQVDLSEKLISEATKSQYVFVYDEADRKVFSVYKVVYVKDEETKEKKEILTNTIDVDYMVIKNHNNPDKKMNAALLSINKDTNDLIYEDVDIKLKSQLRSGYAERFQHIASNHSARIGVDFISWPKSSAE